MVLTPDAGARREGIREVLDHPLGPTAWQLNWWNRQGWISLGSTTYAEPLPAELRQRLIEISRLIRVGLRARDACRLSEAGTVGKNGRRVIPAGPGITIIVDPIEVNEYPDMINTPTGRKQPR